VPPELCAFLRGRAFLAKKLLINADKKTKEALDRYDEQIKSGQVRPSILPHAQADSMNKSSTELQKQHDQVATSLIDALITNVEKNYEARKQAKAKEDAAARAQEEAESQKSRSESPPKRRSPQNPVEQKESAAAVESAIQTARERFEEWNKSSKRKRSRSHSKSKERRRRSADRSRSRSRSRRRRKKRRRRDSSEESKKKAPGKVPEPGEEGAPKTAKELVHYIPRDQSKLLKYTIDWKLIDENDLVEKTMRGWIDARIQEYLGEEEADLTNFAVGLLAHHIPPKDIIAEMEMVLVEDAEGFVVKMWRRLIFESLKIKYTIQA